MRDWVIFYKLKDGTEGDVTTPAVDRAAAWEIFNDAVKENGWQVEKADCLLI